MSVVLSQVKGKHFQNSEKLNDLPSLIQGWRCNTDQDPIHPCLHPHQVEEELTALFDVMTSNSSTCSKNLAVPADDVEV